MSRRNIDFNRMIRELSVFDIYWTKKFYSELGFKRMTVVGCYRGGFLEVYVKESNITKILF